MFQINSARVKAAVKGRAAANFQRANADKNGKASIADRIKAIQPKTKGA